jgi:LAO/AO transport system kinase
VDHQSGALVERVLAGHVASGARLIRLLEDGDANAAAALRAVYPKTGRAQIVGVTGPPGAGKSTLVDALIAGWRERGLRVGVVAVDPSSRFTGGALLGDRVRMQRHSADPGVFIRSMATRGQRGGLARRTGDACLVLDAMGYERVIVETIGVGQDEIEVTRLAHTTAVVFLPGTGDEVQALKAGLAEVGDLLVLNKADHPGADAARRDLEQLAHLRGADRNGWEPRVLETVAVRGEGVPALLDAIEEHGRHLRETGAFARHTGQRARAALLARLHEQIGARILEEAERDAELRSAIEAVESGRQDPYTAADRLLAVLWEER